MTFVHEAELGARYRDTISGIEGTAVSSTLYLHGCERVTLEAMNEKDGELKEYVFDIPRLVKVPTGEAAGQTRRVGGARPPTPRTGLRRTR